MRPPREPVRQSLQTYFVTFQTAPRRPLFREARWRELMFVTLAGYQWQIHLHDFVIMPDHLHLLMTPSVLVERAVQWIKGGYSFRAKRAFAWRGDIWQPGFSDHRIRDFDDLKMHVGYLRKNARALPEDTRPLHVPNGVVELDRYPPWLKPVALEA